MLGGRPSCAPPRPPPPGLITPPRIPLLPSGGFSGKVWSMISPSDFSSADEATLKEIIREAESYLGAQLTAGIAANARAMSLTGFLATVTLVLAGATTNVLLMATPRLALGAVCGGVSLGLLAATWLAIQAAQPTRFWYVGNSPRGWVSDLKAGKSFQTSLAEMAVFYADMIADNGECMARSDLRINLAMKSAWAVVMTGGMMLVVSWQAGVL